MCIFGVQKDFLIPFKAEHSVGMGGGPESASYFQTTMPSQGERGGTGQEKHFSASNGKKVELVNAGQEATLNPHCTSALSRDMSLSGSELHNGLESPVMPPRSRASYLLGYRPTTVIAQRRMKQLLHVSLVMAKGHNEIKLSIRR